MNIPHFLSRYGLLGSALVLGLSGMAQAALYGNFAGANVTYQNVTETDSQLTGPPSVSSMPAALFGAPEISPPNSDDLTFPAISFSALEADGQFEFQDGKLTFGVVPNTPTVTIHSLSFDEGGAWSVDGPTDDATSQATLLFNDLRILAVNGVTLSPSIVVAPVFTETITTQNGSADTSTSNGQVLAASTGGDADGIWDITATFNLDAALASADLTGQITGISVALDDQLLVQTVAPESGLSLAEIDKKHFIVSDVTTSVPEPTSIWILPLCAIFLMRSPYRALFGCRADAGLAKN
jgi:hypothetical protein